MHWRTSASGHRRRRKSYRPPEPIVQIIARPPASSTDAGTWILLPVLASALAVCCLIRAFLDPPQPSTHIRASLCRRVPCHRMPDSILFCRRALDRTQRDRERASPIPTRRVRWDWMTCTCDGKERAPLNSFPFSFTRFLFLQIVFFFCSQCYGFFHDGQSMLTISPKNSDIISPIGLADNDNLGAGNL